MPKITPVILCGGSGTRLWPLSRKNMPKQFLPLLSKESLFQETLRRVNDPALFHPPVIVCHESHRFIVGEQLALLNINNATILLEPLAKNTAPALLLAALHLAPEMTLLALPADHYIEDNHYFNQKIRDARSLIQENNIITFGITPTHPETGYGYIQAGKPATPNVFHAKRFTEKPNLALAKQYCESNFYWNTGMFMLKAGYYHELIQQLAPTMHESIQQAYQQASHDMDFIRPNKSFYKTCPEDSIDYAVMEHAQNVLVMPYEGEWSDVGSFTSLYQHLPQDKHHNATIGNVTTFNTSNCLLHSPTKTLAALGLDNMIIINTPDTTLVANKNSAEQVKALVEKLPMQNENEGHTVFRPWGHFELITHSLHYLVKRITVKPGAALSLQLHCHRAEHWVVVIGTATVTRNEETFLLSENESTFIPQNTRHRLENHTTSPLEIIEIQSGEILDESDIVRFEDVYGREDVLID